MIKGTWTHFVLKFKKKCIVISFNPIFFLVDKIFNEDIESVYIVCHKLFCPRSNNFLTLHYLISNIRLEVCLHTTPVSRL